MPLAKAASRAAAIGAQKARVPALSAVFAALPPDSLDDLIVSYITARR
jgi:hypothetical protein